MNEFGFSIPQNITVGRGTLGKLGEAAKKLGGTHAFIISGPHLEKMGLVARAEGYLADAGIKADAYTDIEANPSVTTVEKATEAFRASGADFIVAFGGGSPMDVAKAVGVVAKYGGSITDYEGAHKVPGKIVPLIAIPTTAGTGSEVTKNTIISDTEHNVKMLLGGPSIIPALAVVDPTFTMTAPPSVTAATGIDALCHAIEAYTSRKAQPLTDTFALSAIKKIHKNLPVCYHDGKNVDARLGMSIAALEAGIAFNNASVTIVHGMSRPIGALFHIAHGVSNAVLLPACMEFAIEENTDRFATIGRIMGVADENTTDHAAAEAMVKEVSRFCQEVGIPTLEKLGVKKEDFFAQLSKMADDALESGSPQNTMRIPTKEQIMEIYRKLF